MSGESTIFRQHSRYGWQQQCWSLLLLLLLYVASGFQPPATVSITKINRRNQLPPNERWVIQSNYLETPCRYQQQSFEMYGFQKQPRMFSDSNSFCSIGYLQRFTRNYNTLCTTKSQPRQAMKSQKALSLHASVSSSTSVTLPVFFLNRCDLGLVYMSLLALQFAIQPILVKKFVPKDKIIGSTYVFVEAAVLLTIALTVMIFNPSTASLHIPHQYYLHNNHLHYLKDYILTSCRVAGIPACLNVFQTLCKLFAYQKLQPVQFNAVNQTKTIFAAIFCFLLFKQKQSLMQLMALGILMLSALVMESVIKIPTRSTSNKDLKAFTIMTTNTEDHYNSKRDFSMPSVNTIEASSSVTKSTASKALSSTAIAATVSAIDHHYPSKMNSRINRLYISLSSLSGGTTTGILACVAASVMSGFGGALSQRTIQCYKVHPILFTAQLSTFSIIYLLFSIMTGLSSDRNTMRNNEKKQRGNLFVGWTPYTLIPILSSALGGILVGMVTKYAGVIQKGFALIVGLLLSGIFQNILAHRNHRNTNDQSSEHSSIQRVTTQQWIGGILAGISIWMHSAFPYRQ